MSNVDFKHRVNRLIKKAGGGIDARFFEDRDAGKQWAVCTDGTTIIGNFESNQVTVKWNGKFHQSMAII